VDDRDGASMTKKVALIHTVGSLAPVFRELTQELVPGATTTDTVDEALLQEAIAAGEVPTATAERLERHVEAALDDGADLVLVTCSSMGGVVDDLRERHGWPVIRVDEAMVDAALAAGSRIGVVATVGSTLRPTAALVERRARQLDRGDGDVTVVTKLVDGAFAKLKAGDTAGHDEAVRTALRELLPEVDAVVLAQASMARVAGQLDPAETAGTPIFSSPRLGIERVRDLLAEEQRSA
jgi:Asp/Glu/hydantoin racemase